MTKQEFEDLKRDVEKSYKEHSPHWRKGQTLFNTLSDLYPVIAEDVLSTDVDPFYVDTVIDSCYEFIYQNYVSK